MIPDPRFNIGYQGQQTQPNIHYQQQAKLSITTHRWQDNHNNTKAAWLAIGPNVLYCLSTIFLGIFMAILQDVDSGGDFDELFGSIVAGIIIIIWLFTSLIVTIISIIAAFIKKCPPMWMIIGPGGGFVVSLLTYVAAISIIVEDISFTDAVENLFGGANGFSLIFAGFATHTILAFATMRLMVIATRDENN